MNHILKIWVLLFEYSTHIQRLYSNDDPLYFENEAGRSNYDIKMISHYFQTETVNIKQ